MAVDAHTPTWCVFIVNERVPVELTRSPGAVALSHGGLLSSSIAVYRVDNETCARQVERDTERVDQVEQGAHG